MSIGSQSSQGGKRQTSPLQGVLVDGAGSQCNAARSAKREFIRPRRGAESGADVQPASPQSLQAAFEATRLSATRLRAIPSPVC